MQTYVGIDVGAKRCEWAGCEAQRRVASGSFEQIPSGHAAVIARLKRFAPARIVLEATGVYYFDLALALVGAGLPVAVINPKSFHHFAKLRLVASKTDRLDAVLLAEHAERMAPPLWAPPAPTGLALRDIGRQISRLTHALAAKQATPRLLLTDERAGIRTLDRRIARLAKAAEQSIAQVPALAQSFARLCTAKSIGRVSAVALLAELCVLPERMKSAQLSRHAGLDVRLTQSGSSVHKPGRLSKTGNRYLRAALYMPALSAARTDPAARAFYQALIARGKKRMQALCALMRKYLTGLWACLKANEPFDSSCLFRSTHTQNA